jgi:two-component system, cell cycle response regulator DivK
MGYTVSYETVFSFNYPFASFLQGCCHENKNSMQVKSKPEIPLMSNNATILYVEDNVDNRTLVRRVLTAEGYAIIEAVNATQALEILKNTKPSLILMDINMPDIDGYTLTTQIKGTPGLGTIPIIALTANVMRGDRERSLEAGCDGYIQKPIDIDMLSEQIERFLRS